MTRRSRAPWLGLVALLVPLLLCGAGVWALDGRATALFVASGADGVRMQRVSLSERLISYDVPNPDDGWQTAIARRLSASGWSISTDFYQWGDTEKFRPIYQRVTRIWMWRLCERAELLGDRAHALVRVRYRFPCP